MNQSNNILSIMIIFCLYENQGSTSTEYLRKKMRKKTTKQSLLLLIGMHACNNDNY